MVVQHNLQAMNTNRQRESQQVPSLSQQKSYHLVTRLTVLVMTLLVLLFLKR